jgi:hypothetical protein
MRSRKYFENKKQAQIEFMKWLLEKAKNQHKTKEIVYPDGTRLQYMPMDFFLER